MYFKDGITVKELKKVLEQFDEELEVMTITDDDSACGVYYIEVEDYNMKGDKALFISAV